MFCVGVVIMSYIQTVTDLAGQRPILSAVVVFLAAFSEAIPVLGAVAPGSAIVIGISVVIGLGNHSIWPVLLAAIAGAVASDGLSYWFGHTFKSRVLEYWPLSAHPEMMTRAQRFFDRHGGKSVVMARFTPVVRAFVPLIAGVSGMSATRFYIANVLSAIAWATSHVLPSAAAGASLGVLGAISGRLVAVLIGLVVMILLLSWVFKITWKGGKSWLASAQSTAYAALSRREGRVVGILKDLIDPEKPSVREAAFLIAIFALAMLGLFNVVEGVLAHGELIRADVSIVGFIDQLRTLWGDRFFVFVTLLGDTPVTTAVAVTSAAWMWWRGQRTIAIALIVTLGVTIAFVLGVKSTMHFPRPTELFHGAEAFSFPSGHATFAATLYGILGWIVTRELDGYRKAIILAVVATFIGAIAFSRIYLGAHWPSDVVAGLLFGAGATAVFAVVFRRTGRQLMAGMPLSAVLIVTLVVVGGWHVNAAYSKGVATYTPVEKTTVLTRAEWLATGWTQLPADRIDLGGEIEEPLSLQWGGDFSELQAALLKQGWQIAVAFDLQSVGGYLRSTTTPLALPVLPSLQDGRPPALTLVKELSLFERSILHIWPTPFVLESPGRNPILIGSIVREKIYHPVGLITFYSRMRGLPIDTIDVVRGLPNATVVTRTTAPAVSEDAPTRQQRVVLAAP